ncbi:GRIP and coiled-coil domain-containing protein 2-like [Littorina saxatilis]|uniref:GRIP and coiled-coil domain-containing protein 2-like n=1 Tax=Littorina saxatilis TaxID=31220 RepID=UPI0038B52999
MPSSALEFRSVCGGFNHVFIGFMFKRAKKKAAMFLTVYTLRNRVDGVTFGLLLSLLFWGGWLMQCGDVEKNPGPGPELRQSRLGSSQSTSQSQDPTLKDVMTMLRSMNSKFDDMSGDVKNLRESYVTLQEEVKDLKEEVSELQNQNGQLQEYNISLEKRLGDMDKKTDDLECRSKRNNIIIHGMERRKDETSDECEAVLKEMITDKLELSEDVQFDRVHRLSAKPNSPVIARCTFYQDKVKMLRAKRKLQGSQIFIGEDFSMRVRDIRRKLLPHLKLARSEGKRATMVFDHLLIEGKKHVLDADGEVLKELR